MSLRGTVDSVTQSAPFGIECLNKIELFFPSAALNLFFAHHRLLDATAFFVIEEFVAMVLFGKSLDEVTLVL